MATMMLGACYDAVCPLQTYPLPMGGSAMPPALLQCTGNDGLWSSAPECNGGLAFEAVPAADSLDMSRFLLDDREHVPRYAALVRMPSSPIDMFSMLSLVLSPLAVLQPEMLRVPLS